MLFFLYILLVCYAPLIERLFPIISIGADAPKIGLTRAILLILFMMFPVIVPFRTFVTSLKNSWIISTILFDIYVMLSVSWSAQPYTSAIISSIFGSQFVPIITGIIGLSLLQNERSFTVFLCNYIAVCVVLSLVACYQYFNHPQIAVRTMEALDSSGLRASATLGNANLLAIFLVVSIPSIIYLRDMLHVGNKATYIILAVIIAGLGTTMSRKGVLTAMLSPLIYYYFTERKIKAVVIACIGVLLLPIIILSTSMFSKRVDSDQVQQELSARAGMASAGVKMFSESPILGKGFGGYYDNILKFNRNLTKAYSAHNIYAEALADYGLIGFSLLATCFMLPIRRATVLFRNHGIVNNSDINPQKFGALLLAVIIPFMCSAYFSGALLYEPKIFSVLYAYICYAYHQ